MKLLGRCSSIAFQAVRFADDWFGLPNKVAESLHFRRDWKNSFSESFKTPTLWIHGASVGELEDLASFFTNDSILSELGFSKSSVVLTASSISARDKLAKWRIEHGFAYAGPLPPESQKDVDAFLEKIKPDVFLISQSDLWPLLLERAYPKLKSGVIWLPSRDTSGKFLAPLCLDPAKTWIGTRNENSHPLTALFRHELIGNLRLDRIVERVQKARESREHALEAWNAVPEARKLSILIGSAWVEDAAFWEKALNLLSTNETAKLQIVVIPHETRDSMQAASIQGILPKARVISVEGILLEAFKGFSAAFVGGGFKTGLHSVLEPAAWGIPVFCGADTRKQPEAKYLENKNILRPLSEPAQLAEWIRRLLTPSTAQTIASSARASAEELNAQRGAGQRLKALIQEFKHSRGP